MEDEQFTEAQLQILEHYVSTAGGNIFVLRNLPQVIKGALFSRYSRSVLGLRSLLLKEFILNEEAAFASISQGSDDQIVAIQKAQNFYDRILDGYGDDSIAELGGAHLAVEHVSMLATKEIEDCRIGGSPLEKSTRYIYFDQKIEGSYRFYQEPTLCASSFKKLYLDTCNDLFLCYQQLIPEVTKIFEEKFPKEANASQAAYSAALRAKVLDCLRGLLPASTLTNMGLFGNGRFFEQMIHKLHTSPLVEMQTVAKSAYQELVKEIPSFVARSELSHRHHQSYETYHKSVEKELTKIVRAHEAHVGGEEEAGVKLISFDPDSPYKVAAALCYKESHKSLADWQKYVRALPQEELEEILDAGAKFRQNRRHKSPRALEHASFTFEIVADFGSYRDLHRHRLLTQERELLTCNYGFWVPKELQEHGLDEPYCRALERAKCAYDRIAREYPKEAQYVVPMAYNVRWYFHVNLRALQWLCELRSSPAGHPTYRYVAQEMARQVMQAQPLFAKYFAFVDFEGYDLGRMGQEERRVLK